MTLNHSWHRVFGSCRCIVNCWTVHVGFDRAMLLKGLGVVQVWSNSYVRRTKSREERGSSMLGCLTPMIAGALPSGLGAAWLVRFMCGFQPAARLWLQSGCLAGLPIQEGLPIRNVVSLLQGLPRRTPEHILGTNTVLVLLVLDADSTEVVYKIRQWSLPGATIVPVLNVSSRVFWLELDDKALLDSYTVLQEDILCDVFSQKCSAAWQGARGERLTVAIMLPGRQDADDWVVAKEPMVSQRRSPNRSFVRNGAGCKPSTCGWRSNCVGVCLLTVCTLRRPLGSPKKNSTPCFLTGLPGATTQIRMKKNFIVDLQSRKSVHGGSNAKIGCHTSKMRVCRWFLTSRAF